MENTRKKPLLIQYSLALLSGQLLKCCLIQLALSILFIKRHRKPISLERLLFQIQARVLPMQIHFTNSELIRTP